MAEPAPALVSIDHVDSSARRRGEDVEVVLAVTAVVDARSSLVLAQRSLRIEVPIEVPIEVQGRSSRGPDRSSCCSAPPLHAA